MASKNVASKLPGETGISHSLDRGNWVPARAGHFLCVDARLEAPEFNTQGDVARITAWRDDEIGTAEISGQEDAMFDAKHPASIMLSVRKNPFAFAEEDAFCDNLVLLISLEDSTSTKATDEVAVVIRFYMDEPPPPPYPGMSTAPSEMPTTSLVNFQERGYMVDSEHSSVPEWIRRRCKRGSPIKVWFLDIHTEHRLCQLREGYRDMVTLGNQRVWLRLQWSVTRSNLSRRYHRIWFMPTVDQEFLREQFMSHVEAATRPALMESREVGLLTMHSRGVVQQQQINEHRSDRTRLSMRDWALIGWQGAAEGTPADITDAIAGDGIMNSSTAALRFIAYLQAYRVAACAPQTLIWIQNLAEAEGLSLVDLLLSRPDLLVLCILILSKVTDDTLAHDPIGVSMISQDIAHVASEACLASFLEVFSRILANTLSKPPVFPAHDREASPSDRTAVVAATCTVVLALLCREAPSSDAELLRDTIDRVITLICRAQSLEVAWTGATRLFPAVLVACSPSIIARELVTLVKRSVSYTKEYVVNDDSTFSGPRVDYLLACTAHLLQQFDQAASYVWSRDILPSAEDWVQLHLIRPSIALCVEALAQAADENDRGDGFDALVSAMYTRLCAIQASSSIPTKLEVGLMDANWAVSQSWKLSYALVEVTCKRETIVCTLTLPLLQLVASELGPDSDERLGSARMTLLQSFIASVDDAQQLQIVSSLFKCLLIHISTYAGAFLSEVGIVKIVAQLVTLLLALQGDESKLVRDTWRAAFGLLVFAAQSWEESEHASWALLTIREVAMHFIQRFVEMHPSLLGSDPLRPVGSSPWFASTLAHGLMRICTTRGVAQEIVDESIAVLNTLLVVQHGGCNETVRQVCKLAVLEQARAPRKELDRWILTMEDICVDTNLTNDLFALRALGKAMLLDTNSAALRFDAVERLVGTFVTSVWWPWAPPPVEFIQHRQISPTVDVSSDPEICLLQAARELHREALSRIDHDHDVGTLVLPMVCGIQLNVLLLLSGALDDIGKDTVVRDLETLVAVLIHLHGQNSKSNDEMENQVKASTIGVKNAESDKDNSDNPEPQYWVRLVAVAIATVEDALKEPLVYLWEQLARIPPAPHLISLHRAALRLHGVSRRRLVVYNGSSWFALAFDPRLSVKDVFKLLSTSPAKPGKYSNVFDSNDGTYLPSEGSGWAVDWSGHVRKDYSAENVVKLANSPLPSPSSQEDVKKSLVTLPPALHVFATFTIRGTDEGQTLLRTFAKTDDPNRVLRIDLRPGKAGQMLDERGERAALGPGLGLGNTFLGEPLHEVAIEEVAWKEAIQEYLVLLIRYLRACLEHDIWLPKPNMPEDASTQQQILFLNMVNTLLDSTLSEDGIGLRAAVLRQYEETEHQEVANEALLRLSEACKKLAVTVRMSLENNLDDARRDEITQLLLKKRVLLQQDLEGKWASSS